MNINDLLSLRAIGEDARQTGRTTAGSLQQI